MTLYRGLGPIDYKEKRKENMGKTKIDVISGFLGAGKTTVIKKLLDHLPKEEQKIIIENEFGEIGIDGGFLKDAGIEIREMNSGCICCSLSGDFEASLREILAKYAPDRVIIEPSGVGKLSDVLKAVSDVEKELEVASNSAITVVDVKKCKMYFKNFGEFFNNQIQFANTVILSRTDLADQKKAEEAVELIRQINPQALIVTTPLEELSGEKITELLGRPLDLKTQLLEEMAKAHAHHHDHDHHEHHHHDHDHEDHEHHEHHDHEEHDHHHDHEEHDHCHHDHENHEHHHEHHHEDHEHCHHDHHHADDIFDSWGLEQVSAMSLEKLQGILDSLDNEEKFGHVLRAKGMLPKENSREWMYFDLVPGETQVREGTPEYSGRVCVIGTGLNTQALEQEFRG